MKPAPFTYHRPATLGGAVAMLAESDGHRAGQLLRKLRRRKLHEKWLTPILRNLALLTPVFPAPTNARTFVILRLIGVLFGVLAKAVDGRMPVDQDTIRYTGVYGMGRDDRPYLMREVLGGGSGGRYYADGEDTIHVVPDSRNLPTEFTEARFPFRVERLGLAIDSGGGGWGDPLKRSVRCGAVRCCAMCGGARCRWPGRAQTMAL